MEHFLNLVYLNQQQSQRWGQAAFNALPRWAAEEVRGKLWDPFYKIDTVQEIMEWINNHLMFDDLGVIAVFNQDKILAERPE